MSEQIPIHLRVPDEDFELKEILIRSDIDRDVFAQFSAETVAAIQRETGLSAGLLPELTAAALVQMQPGEALMIERLEDIPALSSPQFAAYFADVYLNGPYEFEHGLAKYKKNGNEKERGAVQKLEELSREFNLHPSSIVALRQKLGIIRVGDRQEQSFRHLAFAVGVLLGRFDAQTGVLVDLAAEKRATLKLREDSQAPQALLPGLYFTSLGPLRQSLVDPAARADEFFITELKKVLQYKWSAEKSAEIWLEMERALVADCNPQANNPTAADWVEFFRKTFFEYHKARYENRPIYFPLSSARKNFVFYFNIHTWSSGTFQQILADYLNPDLRAMKLRIEKLQEARSQASAADKRKAEKDYAELSALTDELADFCQTLEQVMRKGPDPDRQQAQVPYVMDLDDGVVVNSAALYPLLQYHWKDTKTNWALLATPTAKKDFDWSHLAMRYFPKRVFDKLKKDPSLAVAHSHYGEYKDRDLFRELHRDAAKKWDERNAAPAATKETDMFGKDTQKTNKSARSKPAAKKKK